MFETITETEDRGQVGIGTLIVFIAMVLVAAIAAGVLINTAGSLQSQASDTGTETQQAVANQIEVVHAYGLIDEHVAGQDQIDELRLVIKKSSGSDVIDINSLRVQFTSDDISRNLEYDPDNSTGADVTNGFTSAAIAGTDNGEALTETGERIEIGVQLLPFDSYDHDNDGGTTAEEDRGNHALNGNAALEEGDSATIELVDQSGAKFSYGVTAPATFGNDNVVEV